jgi:sugar lactone lactonase YvrE
MQVRNIDVKKYGAMAISAVLIGVVSLTFTYILQAASPTVVTNPATNISKTGATITGTITSDGGSNITNTGFELGTTVSYGQIVTNVIEEYQQTAEFGTLGSGNLEFDQPRGIAIDSSGNIYVVDSANDRVKKYNSGHVWQSNIVSADLPVDNGFVAPNDVVVLNDDSIAVSDRNSGPGSEGAIIFIDSAGTFTNCYGLGASCSHLRNYNSGNALRGLASTAANDLYITFGTGGGHGVEGVDSTNVSIYDISSFGPSSAEGGFSSPTGLYVDGSGSVYVADTTNNRVQKLSAAEAFVFQIGRSDEAAGTDNGEFSSPVDVALDSDGAIFVVDSGNSRVQKFDSAGVFVSKFGTSGNGDNQMNSPLSIAVDANDDIYVSDTGNNRVVKYELGFSSDLTGHLPTLACGTTYHYRAFATNADGTSYGADQTFTTLGCDVPTVTTRDSSTVTSSTAILAGSHEDSGSISVTLRGFNYGTTASYGSTVSEDGDMYVDSFGTSGGGGNGTFLALSGVGTDPDGNIYTTDQFEDVIQKFSSVGAYSAPQYNVSNPTANYVTTPSVVRGGPDGKLYAMDYTNSRITRFDDDTFTNPTLFAAGAGLVNPIDIAFDSTGNAYVADFSNNRVAKLDSAGTTVILEIGEGVGPGPGELSGPSSVAIDSAGNIFVADTTNSRIQKFSSSGTFVDEVGSSGSGDGQFLFSSFAFIMIDDEDNLYVADTSNNRVQKFDSNLNYVSQFGESGSNPGQFSSPLGIASGLNGDIIVADSGNSRVQIFNERFSLPLSGLSCGNTYHYRAFATNADGTGVGADDTFDTPDCPPTGGGSTGSRFYCNDPLATNYTEDVPSNRVDNDLCRYPEPDDDDLACTGTLFLSKPVRYSYANNPEDVKLLERFLNTYENANLIVDGIYSQSDYLTVIAWQEKYASEILKPWGLTKGTGYVFITSLRKIQKVHDTGCAETESLKRDFCYIYDQKLKRGDNIPLVKFAQKALRAAGTFSGNVDGVFGPITESSVRSFQTQNGLAGNGVIDATTGLKLEEVTCNI